MTRWLPLVIAAILGLAPAASAQDGGVDGIDQAFTRWMKQHGIARGALAVARRDRLVFAKGYGGLKAEQRVLIASLSKAITGVCTAMLIQEGKLRFDSPLGELLDRGAKRYGDARDARLRRATVEQLLSHRTGFSRTDGDPATASTLSDVLSRRAVTQAAMYDLVPGVLRSTLGHEPGARYEYTNASHLLLGVAIEALTGQSYEDYCATHVLEPQGIESAALHPAWGVLGPFGGWNLSGPEYLAFLRAFAPAGPLLSAETRRWMLSPSGKEIATGGPVFYSLLNVRPVSGGHNFFHAGGWAYRLSPNSPSGSVSDSLGSLAVSAAFGASWFVYYEPRPDGAARAALDRELYQAAEAVRTWPETNLYPSLGLR